eukprot:5293707-Amphidinium_carterae.1
MKHHQVIHKALERIGWSCRLACPLSDAKSHVVDLGKSCVKNITRRHSDTKVDPQAQCKAKFASQEQTWPLAYFDARFMTNV